jgi:hypothetical protein
VADRLRRLAASPVPPAKSYTLFGLDEVLHGFRRMIFDVESYRNYFLVSFKCMDSQKVIYFEDTPYGYFVNGHNVNFTVWTNHLTFILYRCLIIGFNSRSYDLPILLVAIQGARASKLKDVSDEIIREELQAFAIERKYGVKALHVNHIDLINVAPITASLKIYAGRLHCERMQDLPFDIDAELTPEQSFIVRDYNINDLDNTELLFNHLAPMIELREQLSREYDQDLRSKSDAQIAEAVIVSELRQAGTIEPKLELSDEYSFYYEPPEWLEFKTPQFQHLLHTVGNSPFYLSAAGRPLCPQAIEDLQPRLGRSIYRIGIGGLHSSEESVCYRADEKTRLVDRDVASFYPFIILNNNYFPEHLGPLFIDVYRKLVQRRLALKKDKNPLEAGLKIAINGTFGKLGNFYSNIYSPKLLTQVTMTGQLALLMQIEMVELAGIPCISANTDGAVYACPVDKYADFENVMTIWEGKTGFVTEETEYEMLASRDVNNYIAIKKRSGGVNRPDIKCKGVYSEKGSAQNSVLSKNPECHICSVAVQEYLSVGTPLYETIYECNDIRKFVAVRTVKGGAEKDGVYLGKAVRWYYAKGEDGVINYAQSGNKVPKSEGARPLMILPEGLPADLDRDRYVRDAEAILYDVGFYARAAKAKLL